MITSLRIVVSRLRLVTTNVVGNPSRIRSKSDAIARKSNSDYAKSICQQRRSALATNRSSTARTQIESRILPDESYSSSRYSELSETQKNEDKSVRHTIKSTGNAQLLRTSIFNEGVLEMNKIHDREISGNYDLFCFAINV